MLDGSKRIVVGRITSVYGVKGWLKIESFTIPPENIFSYQPWHVSRASNRKLLYVRGYKIHGKGWIAALEKVENREMARELIGSDISIIRSQLPQLESGEYYQSDLLGMQVIDQQGNLLGRLQEIVETGANDVMIINGERRFLIPLVWGRYLLEVDQDKGEIRVDWEEPV